MNSTASGLPEHRSEGEKSGGFEELLKTTTAHTGPRLLKGLPLRRKTEEAAVERPEAKECHREEVQKVFPRQQTLPASGRLHGTLTRSEQPSAAETNAAGGTEGRAPKMEGLPSPDFDSRSSTPCCRSHGQASSNQSSASSTETVEGELATTLSSKELDKGRGGPQVGSESRPQHICLNEDSQEGEVQLEQIPRSVTRDEPLDHHGEADKRQSSGSASCNLLSAGTEESEQHEVPSSDAAPQLQTSAPVESEGQSHRDSHAKEGKEAHLSGMRSLKAFWADRESALPLGSLPRPRTPMKSAPASPLRGRTGEPPAKAREAEAAICDRFGNPVMKLGSMNGLGKALAAAEEFPASVPAFARFREAAARAKLETETTSTLHANESDQQLAGSPTSSQGRIDGVPPERNFQENACIRGTQWGEGDAGGTEVDDVGDREVNPFSQDVGDTRLSSPVLSQMHLLSKSVDEASGEDSKEQSSSRGSEGDAACCIVEDAGSDEGQQLHDGADRDVGGQRDTGPPGTKAVDSCGGAHFLELGAREDPCLPTLEESDRREPLDATLTQPVQSSETASVSSVPAQAAAEDTASAGSASEAEVLGDSVCYGSAQEGKLSPDFTRAEAIEPPDFLALNRDGDVGETSGRGSDQDPDWRAQRKHVFILSNSGKPIFTLHGEWNRLAGFMAVIHAMISFSADRGDRLQSLRAGKHTIVFMVRGPLYLVVASRQGEPVSILTQQLSLLHSQVLCILTSGFERMFARNPSFDARRLLGGTDGVLRTLVNSFGCNFWALMSAWPSLPLASALRHSCIASLQAAVKVCGALYGVLLSGDQVLALCQSRAHPFLQGDLMLLSNFIMASPSFLQSSESFTPVCLPAFNSAAFLHAYVHFLNTEARVCLVLLSSDQQSFYRLSEAGQQLRKELEASVQEVATAALSNGGRIHLADLPVEVGGGPPGTTPLLHFVYKSPARTQLVTPAWSCPLDDEGFRQEVMAAYTRVHADVFQGGSTSNSGTVHAAQRVHYQQNCICTILAFLSSDYELYAAFDVLVKKPRALEICQKLSGWIKANQALLFFPV